MCSSSTEPLQTISFYLEGSPKWSHSIPRTSLIAHNVYYHATEILWSIGTHVKLDMAMIKSHGQLKVIMVSSITSIFRNVKRKESWMNSRKITCKTLIYLLSCMIKLFKDSSNVKVRHRLDDSRLVHDELSSLDSSMNIWYIGTGGCPYCATLR